MTASISNSWFRSSALEDLRPSQVVFSGRLGPCEKPTSKGGREGTDRPWWNPTPARHDAAAANEGGPPAALGRSPDTRDTFIMRMYFELLRDAAGQTNQPYDRSVRDLKPNGRTTCLRASIRSLN
jgi:hypothetical protein